MKKNNLDVFYCAEWDEEEHKHINVDEDDDGDIIAINFYVNDILALQVDPDKIPVVLSRNYSKRVYNWIISYMRTAYDIKHEDIMRSILHDL